MKSKIETSLAVFKSYSKSFRITFFSQKKTNKINKFRVESNLNC
jgi:hypothetical protein